MTNTNLLTIVCYVNVEKSFYHYFKTICSGHLCGTKYIERYQYRPYEGLIKANQISRKLGAFDRKLEGSHSIIHCYFDR